MAETAKIDKIDVYRSDYGALAPSQRHTMPYYFDILEQFLNPASADSGGGGGGGGGGGARLKTDEPIVNLGLFTPRLGDDQPQLKTDDGLALLLPILLAALPSGGANFYDVIQPQQVPPTGVECLPWAEAGDTINSQWAIPGKIPPNASNFCAQQGNGSASAHHTSAYCIDSATRNLTSCRSAQGQGSTGSAHAG